MVDHGKFWRLMIANDGSPWFGGGVIDGSPSMIHHWDAPQAAREAQGTRGLWPLVHAHQGRAPGRSTKQPAMLQNGSPRFIDGELLDP